MTKRQITQHYKDCERILLALSFRCAVVSQRQKADVFSEACLLFVQAMENFDATRGSSVKTHVYRTVKHGLYRWSMRQNLLLIDDDLREPSHELTPDRDVCFDEWLSNLNDECRMVANIILHGPNEAMNLSIKMLKPRMIRGALLRYLRKQGWACSKIRQTMIEMKEAVAEL